MRVSVGVLAALAVLLAACTGPLPTHPPALPEAGLAPVAGRLNQQATHEAGRQANELSIAVNPLDPLNIVATGKDYTQPHAGQCVWDGIYVSHDGGATWNNSNLMGSPWKARDDAAQGRQPELHPDLSKFHCATDPVVAFGPDGTLYWSVMPYQCDPASGSPTGRYVLPDGGFNDWLWTCSSMYVLASSDGGRSWDNVTRVAFGPRLEHDKQWLAVSPPRADAPAGLVLLCWDRDPSYQVASLLANPTGQNPAQQLSAAGFITCSTSKDKGRTWTEPVDANRDPSDPRGMATTWGGALPWVDFGPDGTAWMAALDGDSILVTNSSDGLAWAPPVTVGAYRNPAPGGEYGWPVLRGSDFRMFAVPTLAVDRTDGPYSGSVYVAWFDHSAGHGRILFAYSRDHGRTWSEPQRVRDDAPRPEHDQFMPAVSVGPDGTVDLVWMDRRMDPANHRFDAFYTFSLDGGVSWARDLRLSEVSSDEQFSHHQNGMVFLGDYIDIDSTHGSAHPVWIDTRNHKADAYTATVLRPSANPA